MFNIVCAVDIIRFLLVRSTYLSCFHQSPDSSFTGSGGAAEEELRNKLLEEEANSRALQEHLNTTRQLLQEKETAHAEQVTLIIIHLMVTKRKSV